MPRVTVKTSTIFISVGEKTQVFRSVDDVPPPLRKQLEQSTNGINSATILIADRRGREEILKAIRGLPSSVRSRLAGTATNPGATPHKAKPQQPAQWLHLRNWVELVLPVALGAVVWVLFSLR